MTTRTNKPTNHISSQMKQITKDLRELERVNEIKKDVFANELKQGLGEEIKQYVEKKPLKENFFKKILRIIGF